MSEENTENMTKSGSNFAQTFVDHYLLSDINFNGHCLINNISIPEKVINLYISYTLKPQFRNLSKDFTLDNCLFASVKLNKIDLFKINTSIGYIGNSIDFDSPSEFLFTDGSYGKIIFGADLSWSVHIDNKRKDTLILGKGQAHGLDDTTSTVEAKYPINITQSGKRFVLSRHYNGSSSFLFVYATKIYRFKVKVSKTKDYALCLRNISNDFAINNKKKNRLKEIVNFFFCWF